VLSLSSRLRDHGFAPVVAGPAGGTLAAVFRDAGVEVIDVPTDRLTPGAIGRLVQVIRARGIRLVHTHGKGAGLHGRLAARAVGIPAVHTFHGIHFEGYAAPKRATYLALERALARLTAAIVCVSAAEHAEAVRLGVLSAGRGRVVPNGVDIAAVEAGALDRGAARQALGLTADGRYVGAVARLDPVKGLDVLVQAIAQVPGSGLVLIGAGPERARLASLAGAHRVRFAGEIVGAARLLRAFDACVTASAKEGMPLGVLEAMALGQPVVASDIPAHREVLGEDYPGLSARSPEAFARVITRVIGEPGLAEALGARNRLRANDFDLERMVEGTVKIYRELSR
jgi:glycosyltransferase involved in cell wall biosynthesis